MIQDQNAVNIERFTVATALSLAKLHLSVFLENSKKNDKRPTPNKQLIQVMPYPDGGEVKLTDFQAECKELFTINQEYIKTLKAYRSISNDKRLRLGIDITIQFYEKQNIAIDNCLETNETEYLVIFDYYPSLTKDLERTVNALENEAKKIVGGVLGGRFSGIFERMEKN